MKDFMQQGQAHLVALPEIHAPPTGKPVFEGNLDALHGVKVKVSVMVGEVQTTLGDLLALKEAAVLKIDRPVDTPVDVLVDGNCVARGQLVVVDGQFGVRITEVTGTGQ
jgi:flagellar motor switch protein FliN